MREEMTAIERKDFEEMTSVEKTDFLEKKINQRMAEYNEMIEMNENSLKQLINASPLLYFSFNEEIENAERIINEGEKRLSDFENRYNQEEKEFIEESREFLSVAKKHNEIEKKIRDLVYENLNSDHQEILSVKNTNPIQ